MVLHDKGDRPLSELFSELGQETTTLVRQEIALAKTELAHKASKLGKHAAYIATGGAVGYAGFIALMFGLIFALAQFMPLWGAAFIVGVVFAAVSGMVIYQAVTALKKMNLAPQQTVDTLKEDAQWLKHQVTS